MNITLSAEKRLVEKARQYAKKRNTSLNNLIRDYLKKVVDFDDIQSIADEFEQNALNHGGKSEQGYKFDREEFYDRSGH